MFLKVKLIFSKHRKIWKLLETTATPITTNTATTASSNSSNIEMTKILKQPYEISFSLYSTFILLAIVFLAAFAIRIW